jgi:hypothetical protein
MSAVTVGNFTINGYAYSNTGVTYTPSGGGTQKTGNLYYFDTTAQGAVNNLSWTGSLSSDQVYIFAVGGGGGGGGGGSGGNGGGGGGGGGIYIGDLNSVGGVTPTLLDSPIKFTVGAGGNGGPGGDINEDGIAGSSTFLNLLEISGGACGIGGGGGGIGGINSDGNGGAGGGYKESGVNGSGSTSITLGGSINNVIYFTSGGGGGAGGGDESSAYGGDGGGIGGGAGGDGTTAGGNGVVASYTPLSVYNTAAARGGPAGSSGEKGGGGGSGFGGGGGGGGGGEGSGTGSIGGKGADGAVFLFIVTGTNGGGGGGNPVCFLRSSKILCLNEGLKEEYMAIENMRVGTKVKTLNGSYVKVHTIGKTTFNNPDNADIGPNRLFKLTPQNYPELTEDLIITGCHSILVDKLEPKQKARHLQLMKSLYMTTGKFRLMAFIDEKAEPYQNPGDHEIWHFALENEEDVCNYGVYANGGLLVESASIKIMTERAGLVLIE